MENASPFAVLAVARFIGWIGMIGVTLWLLRLGLGNLSTPERAPTARPLGRLVEITDARSTCW